MTNRDTDLVDDDHRDLEILKEDFIALLNRAETLCGFDWDEDEAINCEQSFDDLLHKRHVELCSEGNASYDLPKSKRLAAWERKPYETTQQLLDRAAAQAELRDIITNPATYQAAGKEI